MPDEAAADGAAMPPPLELTLILAATRDMGIGRAGTLPWTGLRKEMAYFARVTKRLPHEVHPPALNAVVMGRKTWESIPPKFRPLQDRLNVVISRSSATAATAADEERGTTAVYRASSLDQALAHLRDGRRQGRVGRVFVVGGAQIYDAALRRPEARRVLLTRVLTDFECDTFFPLALGTATGEAGEEAPGGAWVRRSKAELDAWVGEEVPEGVQREGDTEYEFQMWERVDES